MSFCLSISGNRYFLQSQNDEWQYIFQSSTRKAFAFDVRACRDAKLALLHTSTSKSGGPREMAEERVYEIILGSESNMKSVILKSVSQKPF